MAPNAPQSPPLIVPNSRPDAQRRSLGGAVEDAIGRVVARGVYTPNAEVAAFEAEFAAATGTRHAVGTASGGWALTVGLLAAGLRRGDEVLSVPNVDVGASAPISHAGGQLRFVDVDLATHTMSPDALEAAIGPRTRAIVIVHLYGYPAAMDELLAIARRHELTVVEDCSLAPGATAGGRPVGGRGDLGTFSLSSTKPLNAAGKAGALVTDRPDIAERARELVNYGFDLPCLDAINAGVPGTPFRYRSEGYNAAMDELQAAVLRAKLPALPTWVARRRHHVQHYRTLLADDPAVELIEPADATVPAPRVLVVRVPNRDEVVLRLHEAGIASNIAYVPPLHLQTIYADRRPAAGLPACERLADELLCLPCYPELEDTEVELVAATLRREVALAAG